MVSQKHEDLRQIVEAHDLHCAISKELSHLQAADLADILFGSLVVK